MNIRSPVASAVEEADEEEFLLGPVLHQLSDPENVPRRGGNELAVEMAARPGHLRIYDLRGGSDRMSTQQQRHTHPKRPGNLVTQSNRDC